MNLRCYRKLLLSFGLLFFVSSFAGTLSVLTYNTNFLPFVAKKYRERRKTFAAEVARTGADVIALQEVWTAVTRKKLISDFSKLGYPYNAYTHHQTWPKGFLGSGLIIFSKYPIRDTEFLAFKTFTRPEEFFSGKGVMRAVIDHPDLGLLQFYNTHLGAVSYGGPTRGFDQDHANSVRKQMQDIYHFIDRTRDDGIPSFLVGDFNAHPTFWDTHTQSYTANFRDDYKILKSVFGFEDVFPESTAIHNPEAWVTFDARRNPLIRPLLKPDIQPLEGKIARTYDPPSRFDYIWHRTLGMMRPELPKVVMDDREGKIMSDHFGLRTVFDY